MLKSGVLCAAAAVLLAANCAGADTEGESGAQFLRIGVGAKASALGETGAVSGGAESMFYNPAGLNEVGNAELTLSQVQWVQDMNYSNLAAAKKIGGGVYGLAVNYFSVPSTTKYDKFGNKLSDEYSDTDMAASLGYARRFGRSAGLGLAIKYITSKLDDESASAMALDAGFEYEVLPGALSLGFAAQNVGTQLKYRSQGDPLPLNLKFGGRYLYKVESDYEMAKTVGFFTDVNQLRDAGLYMNFGADMQVNYAQGASYSFRAGYRTNSGITGGGASLGLGVDLGTYAVDYAYSPMGDLGQAHRLTLTVKFDGGVKSR